MLEPSPLKNPSFLQLHAQKLIIASLWASILIAYVVYSSQNGLSPLDNLRQVIRFLAKSNWGPLIFIGLYVLRPLLLFSAGLLTIASGILFGPVWGVVYTVIGSNLGASLAYFIGRSFGQGSSHSRGSTRLSNYIERLRKNSFETVFLMRLVFLPYDLVNYLAGFLRINFGAFLLATMLGSLPGTISFALFGASADGLIEGTPSLDWRVLASAVGIFVLSLLISRILKRREEKHA